MSLDHLNISSLHHVIASCQQYYLDKMSTLPKPVASAGQKKKGEDGREEKEDREKRTASSNVKSVP